MRFLLFLFLITTACQKQEDIGDSLKSVFLQTGFDNMSRLDKIKSVKNRIYPNSKNVVIITSNTLPRGQEAVFIDYDNRMNLKVRFDSATYCIRDLKTTVPGFLLKDQLSKFPEFYPVRINGEIQYRGQVNGEEKSKVYFFNQEKIDSLSVNLVNSEFYPFQEKYFEMIFNGWGPLKTIEVTNHSRLF